MVVVLSQVGVIVQYIVSCLQVETLLYFRVWARQRIKYNYSRNNKIDGFHLLLRILCGRFDGSVLNASLQQRLVATALQSTAQLLQATKKRQQQHHHTKKKVSQ